MSGMMNAAVPVNGTRSVNGAAAPPYQWSSPILQEAEQRNEAGIAASNAQAYKQIVVAGLAAGLTRGPKSIVAKLLKNPDPVKGAARGAVALVLILRREAQGRDPRNVMPLKAMIPAAITLMLHALDFVNRTGKVKVGTPELVRAAHIFANDMFGAFNITPPMLHRVVERVQAITEDPVAMARVNMKAGIVQHPNAPTATPMPAA